MEIERFGVGIAVLPWQFFMTEIGLAVSLWQLFIMEFGIYLPFYLAIGDELFGTYRIEHLKGGCLWCAVVRYGSADTWWFRIFWGFVLCVEALFGICLGMWSCPHRGAFDDVNDTTRALVITILPVYM